jgi:kynurenine formamidase
MTPLFQYSRVVDLSRPLHSGENDHPWLHYEAEVQSIVEDPSAVPPEGRWYVVTQLALSGHAGTHVEAPLHAVAGGASIGELPVTQFFGDAVILDLTSAPSGEPIDLACLRAAAAAAGGVQHGDIVFFRFDWDGRGSPDYPPYPAEEALRWLVDQGVKLVGIDSPGLEVRGNRALPNHHTLLDRNVPLIESLVNLESLQQSRVWVFAVPIPAHGTDAMPLRVLAFEAPTAPADARA